ncbi:hypothetical protein H721_01793 [Brucella ovis IntaBari-2006-46-332]|uniref:Uncharacterized protein n=1 Tax=Brucella ovis (strain ATCC 25840 / 63/290 / NCTC 10512) TaxID=444178 RepID=A0A0H3ASF7_BRUO2|nr:hypothetical protein [Brucella ovis]ABQ61615.1 hypothetical protein BOV_1787 [Brucella ovis ATCC 25840]ENR03401.1 hypothetical protein C010_01788 [Brucella ovis 80/125]ENR07399.1 hypothetical protein C961_01767 [Brucella ovis F8/05B]ENS94297.1 hypothetical protein B999_02109 [Brucella ovis 63/96]ENS98395.1 hypothetical protein C009_01796 [Brucella ovis 81/8]
MTDLVHIHEDDWGMRNLFPLAAFSEVKEDIAKSATAAAKHQDASGFGYTDVYLIEPPSISYADVGLLVSDAEGVLLPILPRVQQFRATSFQGMTSGKQDSYGTYQDDTSCFGLGRHCYLKLDKKGPLVEGIWFGLDTDDVDAIGRLRMAIEAIDALVPSVIADYFLDISGPVGADGVLDSYFEAFQLQHLKAKQAVQEFQAKYRRQENMLDKLRKLVAFLGRFR